MLLDLTHAPLERAQVRALIASRVQGLQFSKDVSAAARRVRLHPGENLLPLSSKRIFAGPSPVQSTRASLLLMGNLIRFASFLQDQLCCACGEIKRHQRCRRRWLTGGGTDGFTAKGRLLQLFYLLEEPQGVERFPDGMQFLLLSRGLGPGEQHALQRRFGCVVDPTDFSSLDLFGYQLHRRLEAIHIPVQNAI
jgi:hypothetical protein